MLVIGETFNNRKAELWDFIHSAQGFIVVVQKINTPQAHEIAKVEQELIRAWYAELKDLTRWFKQSGLKPSEPYKRG